MPCSNVTNPKMDWIRKDFDKKLKVSESVPLEVYGLKKQVRDDYN